MLIGFSGKMGSGKTLSMSIFAILLSAEMKIPIHANYRLQGSKRIKSFDEVGEISSGIIAFDEMWLTLDARQWHKAAPLTHWVNQSRKKNLLVLYTTQHFRQLDNRVRAATDIVVFCERTVKGHSLRLVDPNGGHILKKIVFTFDQVKPFYGIYDTTEVLTSMRT